MAYNYNDPYGGGDPYAQQRKQVTDSAQAAGQSGLDAITRRYAAQGNLNSGAYAQAVNDNTRNTQAATESGIGNLDSQQAQAAQQAGEFGAQLGQQGSEFQQQLGQQGSEFGQSQGQQLGEFQQQLGQQGSQFSQSQGQQASEFGQQLGQQASQFGTSVGLQQQQINNDQAANAINAQLAQYQEQHSGGMFGGGGTLGLGLDSMFSGAGTTLSGTGGLFGGYIGGYTGGPVGLSIGKSIGSLL